MPLPPELAVFWFFGSLVNAFPLCIIDLWLWELAGEYESTYRILALLCMTYLISLEQGINYLPLAFVAPLAYHIMPSPGAMLFLRAIYSPLSMKDLDRLASDYQSIKFLFYALLSGPDVIMGLLTARFMAILTWAIPKYWVRLLVLFVPNIGGFMAMVRSSGFLFRALMRHWRYSILLLLGILDDFRLRRSWVLIQRELEKRPTATQTTSEESLYRDLTIEPDEQKFRVLRILKGTEHVLECELNVVSLDDTTKNGSVQTGYEAISYRWRSTPGHPSFPILINKQTFEAQPNVYRLLRDIRLPDKDRCIWIDSICINQNDTDDSAVQIPLMYQIYSQAERVISWFGDSREGIGGMTALKRVLRTGLPNESDLWYIINSPFSFQLVAWMKIAEFLRHDYFTRMWMIQEVALSKKLTMIKGGEELEWSEFATILPHLHGPQGERFLREPDSFGRWYLNQKVSDGIKGALSMHVAREMLSGDKLDALDLLKLPKQAQLVQIRLNTPLSGPDHRLRRLPLSAYGVLAQLLSLPDIYSTVPEDKIYGISGLIERSAQQPVIYGQDASSTSNIIRDFASKILCQQETSFPPYFDLAGWGYKDLTAPISSPKWSSDHPQFLDLPSWVPDIHQTRTRNPAIDGQYLAGTAEPKRVSSVPDSPDLLKISMSREIGTIASITTSVFEIPDPFDPDVVLHTIRAFIAEAKNLTRSLWQSPYQSPREAFTRTIFGDVFAAAGPLPPIPAQLVPSLQRELDLLIMGRMSDKWKAPHGIMFELGRSLNQHRFCVLSSGHFGLVPLGCKRGDGVVIVWGAQTPFVLRKATEDEEVAVESQEQGLEDQFVLLGSCYLHGFMNEEGTRANFGDRDVVVR